MSEKVEGVLEMFSPVLLQEYIRLMTAAVYIKHENNCEYAEFVITPDNYHKIEAEPLKATLIGLDLAYDETNGKLRVVPDAGFLKLYENKIMNGVALKYFDDYGVRYANYITCTER
jgi:hypothetical protein